MQTDGMSYMKISFYQLFVAKAPRMTALPPESKLLSVNIAAICDHRGYYKLLSLNTEILQPTGVMIKEKATDHLTVYICHKR
jgi:hypothetical protein